MVNPQNTNGASRFSGFIKIPSSPAGRSYLIPFYFNLQPSSDVHHTWLSSPVVPCHTITSSFFCSHSVSWDTFKIRLPIWPTDPIPPCPEASSSVAVLPTGTFRRHFLGELLSTKIWAKKERLLNRETAQTHVIFNWTINLSRFSAGAALRDVMENYFSVRARFHNTKKQGKTSIKPSLFSQEVSWWGFEFRSFQHSS